MKTTSAYKGYRVLYDVNRDGTIVGLVYADGFEFKPMFMFSAESKEKQSINFVRK